MGKQVRTVRIGRKIQPKQFESFEIAIEIQDVLEGDVAAAATAQNERVTADFKETYDAVTKELGIFDKPVAVTQTTDAEVKHAVVAPPNGKARNLAPTPEEINEDFFDRI